MSNICHNSRVNLHLHIVDGGDVGFLFNVSILEIDARHIALGYDVCTKHEGSGGYECGCNHVGAQQAFETHACALHGNDFAFVGQL